MAKAKTVKPTLGPNKGKTLGWSFSDPAAGKKKAKQLRVKYPDK